MSDPLEASRRTTAFRGAILTVGMRWMGRLLGLVSTLVLARLLVPEDFGLVAMATVVAGFLDILLDLGVASALIQNTKAGREHFDTAWTLRICQMTAAAVVMAASAPLVATFYGDARITPILLVVAITAMISGFENIGTVSFQKNMEFGRDFQYFFLKRMFGVAFTIGAAFALRSYWALVLGSLVAQIIGVAISYWLSDFRPRLSFSRVSEIWSFSKWNLVSAVGNYLANSLSRFLVGRRADAAVMGAYTIGEEIASLPTSELLAPLGRVMFPVFAAAKHNPVELLRVVRLSLAVQALLAIPAGVGLALVARDAIPLLLGANWLTAVPFAEVIALASIPLTLCHSAVYLLGALGLMRTVAIYHWAKVAMLALLILVAFPETGAEGIALAYLVTSGSGLIVIQVLARAVLPTFDGRVFLLEIWRPLLATVAMLGTVVLVADAASAIAVPLRLAATVGCGATAYAVTIVVLWRLSGAPDGAETYVLRKLRPIGR